MWAWQSGKCARYLHGGHQDACTHYAVRDPACGAAGPHSGWLRNGDTGWRCEAHRDR